MMEFRNKALNILKSYPKSEAREALEEMVYYTTSRKI